MLLGLHIASWKFFQQYACHLEQGFLLMHTHNLNHQRELFSGLIRLHVLHHACHEPIFGLGMIEELARHGYRLSPGTLYPLLDGLEQKGLLRSSRKLVEGRFRRFYRATRAGRKALKTAKLRVKELFGELFEDEL
jgi:PadR family transcriptional regulator, regulatory protein PadR